MSRRKILNKYQLFNQIDSSTDPESEPTDISGIDKVLYHLTVDSSVLGELKVLFCNDSVLKSDSVYVELDFNIPLTIDGSLDTEYMATVENGGFKWLKLSYTNNAGTGNIDTWISGTTIGA